MIQRWRQQNGFQLNVNIVKQLRKSSSNGYLLIPGRAIELSNKEIIKEPPPLKDGSNGKNIQNMPELEYELLRVYLYSAAVSSVL